ncbi:hypothetical protein B0H10DRAFT_2241465 [Mycena sp. CBHHK59/15]|nr:hypothetical protein B0H10DRAFT_2241465 [Mycena sp. CBHHK59/15]
MESSSAPPTYHPLFTDPTADTVLRAADGTLFRVPTAVLQRTTSFFSSAPSSASALPLPLPEPAPALATVLAFLCGLESPPPASFDALEDALALAERWGAPGALARLRCTLGGPAFLAEPLRLYGLAVRRGWGTEARVAARATLGLALWEETHRPALGRLPADALLGLLALHRRRRDALASMLAGGAVRGVSGSCCASCGGGVSGHEWREYVARIFLEMDARPLGDTVLGFAAVDEWREAVACWNAKCAAAECRKPIYDREAILQDIKACIETLPDEV